MRTMLSHPKPGVNANVDNPKSLTRSKEIWSGWGLGQGFSGIILGMQERAQIVEKEVLVREDPFIRKRELQTKDKKDLAIMARNMKLPREVLKLDKNGLINEIMQAENAPESSNVEASTNDTMADQEGNEPPVTNEAEKTLELVHSPRLVEEELLAKIKANFTDTNKGVPSTKSPERIRLVSDGVDQSSRYYSRRRVGELPSSRSVSSKLESAPTVVATEVVKSIEVPKPVAAPIVLEKPRTLLHPEDLVNKKEPVAQNQVETIAQKIFKNEHLTLAEEKIRDENTEVTSRVQELWVGKKSTPAAEVRPELISTSFPKSQYQNIESKKPMGEWKPDGLVAFNLGKLGINENQLKEQIPGFFELTPEQQNYCLEKLRQKVGHDLDQSTVKELDLAKGVKGFFKSFRAGGVRSRLAKETKAAGLASYKENLEVITGFVRTRGLSVEMTEKGMALKFLSRKPENEKHREIIEEFNRRATALAEIPYDKTTDDRTPLQVLQKKKYEKARKAFDEVQNRLLGYENTKSPEDEAKKLLEFSNIEDDIRMNQALTYNQDATTWIGQKIQKLGLAEKGVVMAAGFATRGLAKYAAGFGGGLVASALLGGVMGKIRKGQEFQNINKDKRYGDAVQPYEKGEARLEKRAGVKEFIDSKNYAQKINDLVQRIEKSSPDKRQALIQTLQNRVMVARERDEAGLVRFGNVKEELQNKFAFIQSMKEAQAIIVENDPEFMALSQEVAKRLNDRYFKDGEKDTARKEEMEKAFWRGVRNGAILFGVGFEANDLLFHNGEATRKGLEWLNNATKDIVPVAEIAEEMRIMAMQDLSTVSDRNIIDTAVRGKESLVAAGKEAYAAGEKMAKSVAAGLKEVSDRALGAQIGAASSIQNEFNRAEFYANRGGLASPESSDVVRSINPISENTPYVAEPDNTFVRTPANVQPVNFETGGRPVNFPEGMPRPSSLPYDATEIASSSDRIAPVARVSVEGRGVINAIKELQRGLWDQYGGNMPENLKSFAEGNPDRIAIGWGGFRPGEVNESLALAKGGSFVVSGDGRIIFESPNGAPINLSAGEKLSGEFFDSSNPGGAREVVAPAPKAVSPENLVSSENNVPETSVNQTDDEARILEERKNEKLSQGFTYAPNEGGDVFTKEIHPEVPKNSAPWYAPENTTSEALDYEGAEDVAVATEEPTKEILAKSRFVVPKESALLAKASLQHGGMIRAEGNVVFFKDGSVGFYAEDMDQNVAGKFTKASAEANAKMLGINTNTSEPLVTRMKGSGLVRYLSIYKKAQ